MKNDLSTSEKAKYDELDEFVKSIDSNEHDLIAVLHRAQSIFGYLPEEVQRFIAEELNIPVVKVYGVATFYSFFTMKKQGKYVINVCLGTACFVRGSEKMACILYKRSAAWVLVDLLQLFKSTEKLMAIQLSRRSS